MSSKVRALENQSQRLREYLQIEQPAGRTLILPPRTAGPVVLSFGQEQIWLHLKIAPDSGAYNEAVTIYRKTPVEPLVLERAFNEVVQRHEAWRTTFHEIEGRPVQVVHPFQPIRLPFVDLRERPESERESRALEILSAEGKRPYDLARGPLVRPTLVRMAEADYRLLLAMHHIVFDGFSIYRVFLPELAVLYDAFGKGLSAPLPALPMQYADFARWQQESARSTEVSASLAYWREKLAGDPPLLLLPSDRLRPAVQTFRGATFRFSLPARLCDDLRELSRKEGVTLYMTLLTAFKVLLHRYTGEDDIVVGGATAGRHRRGMERLIGFFLNTVPLRTDLSGDPTFREVLTRTKHTAVEAMSHDDLPFAVLVKELRPHRGSSVNPFFQILFSIEPPLASVDSAWEVRQCEVELGVTKFDLDFQLDERPEGIFGHCCYSTDLFAAATIERMIRQWQCLLEGAVVDPSLPISEIDLFHPAEKRQLLEWNQTSVDFPGGLCIHQVFEAQARRSPEDVAVILNDEQWTYCQLDGLANRVARRLLDLGVKPDTLVGLFVERSLEMIVGLLGILKVGGAYLPLDADCPPDRLAFVLKDADVKIVVTQERLLERLSFFSGHVLIVDAQASEIVPDDQAIASGVGPTNLAYVMYTSGSTGRPKGVAVEHRSVVNLVHAMESVTQNKSDTYLQLAPLSFDASTFEIWVPLLRGNRCVLFPGKIATAASLREIIKKREVATLWLTRSLFCALIDEAPDVLLPVRTILVGGEPLSVPHIRRAQEHLPAAEIINGYGPTEATTFTCLYPIPRPLESDAGSIPIGRPISNTRVYVLDRNMCLCPVGVPGELYIAGQGLARGYLNQPALTAQSFVPDLFSQDSGTRLYKSGDLARYRADGNIEFLGRLDRQIKIRGFRLEPQEVETAILEHPMVHAAAVVAQESMGSKRIVAHVVAAPSNCVNAQDLMAFLRRRLPEYMLPAEIVFTERLPLLENGKIDWKTLEREPRFEKAPRSSIPAGEIEARLLDIWERVLPTRPIEVDRSFFEMGGHSLSALGLIHSVELAFGKEISWATFLSALTIEQLAAVLRNQNSLEQVAF